MDGGNTMRPIIDRPDDETLDKIDFVVQGLENGLFKDLAKKIDFHQKLKGEDSKKFIKSLVEVIDAQANELSNIQDRLEREQATRMSMEAEISALQEKVRNYNTDMRGIANALMILSNPDPLGQNTTYVDSIAAENFISEYKAKY